MGGKDQQRALSATEGRQLLWESGEYQRLFVSELIDPRLAEAIRQFRDSPAIQEIRRFQESPAYQLIKSIQESPSWKAVKAVGEAFKASEALIRYVPQAVESYRNLQQQLAELRESPLVAFLSPEGGPPAEMFGIATISVVAPGEASATKAVQLEMDREIVAHLKAGNEQALSPEQRGRLNYVLFFFMALLALFADWTPVRDTVCDINARFGPETPFPEIRRYVRTQFCGLPASDVRIVRGDRVNLRNGPSMKSEVLTQLSSGLVVAIVSRDNRDWLEVSFKRDGYVIEGWVSRKYLARIR